MNNPRLTTDDIQEIVRLFVRFRLGKGGGLSKSELARKFHVDNATIFYHLRKHKFLIDRTDDDSELWAFREKQGVCNHPSFKCSVCGVFKDNITAEYIVIQDLRKKVDYLEGVLRLHKVGF